MEKRKIGIIYQETPAGYDLNVGHIFNMNYTPFAEITPINTGWKVETIFGKNKALTLDDAKEIAESDLLKYAKQIIEALEKDIN